MAGEFCGRKIVDGLLVGHYIPRDHSVEDSGLHSLLLLA